LLTAGDGAADADPERPPLRGALPGRVLVHPARPTPVATAPPRSKNSRRSTDTPKTVPTFGQFRRAYAADADALAPPAPTNQASDSAADRHHSSSEIGFTA
jgi:hypothetical protein